MSAWIAVVYDIFSKARELAAQGDPSAAAFLVKLACFIHGVEGERQARWPLGVREGGAICAVCAELTA
jgi:hypothetical protein